MEDFKFTHSKEEYSRLCSESQMRIREYYSGTFKMITIAIAIWTIAMTLYGFLFKKNICRTDVMVLHLVFCVFCLMPIIILVPFSAICRDHMKKICMIGSYVRIFYELPSIDGKFKIERKELYAWESVHGVLSNIYNKDKKSKSWQRDLTSICIVLSVIASLLILGSIIYYFAKNGWVFSDYAITVLVFGVVAIGACIFIGCYTSSRNSMQNNIIKEKSAINTEILNQAQKIGLIDEQTKNHYVKLLCTDKE